jgi:hypothetical protein
MINNLGVMRSAIEGIQKIKQNHGSIINARRSYLSIKKKREDERAERKRKILAQRNQ